MVKLTASQKIGIEKCADATFALIAEKRTAGALKRLSDAASDCQLMGTVARLCEHYGQGLDLTRWGSGREVSSRFLNRFREKCQAGR
jgi:hypothetical protein